MLLCFGVLIVCCSFVKGQSPPDITLFAENRTGKLTLDEPSDVKKEFKLLCRTTGSTPMTFSWKHNGKPVVEGRGISIVNDKKKPNEQVLWYDGVTPRDDGKYQCLVKNAYGGTFTRKMRVKVTYADDFEDSDSVIQNLDNIVVGSPLRLVCPKHSGKAAHKDFGAIHFWGRKKGALALQTLATDKKNRVLLPNGDFLFLHLTQDDVDTIKGFYDEAVQCIVTAGNSIFYSKQFKLKAPIKTEIKNFGPKFQSPDDMPMTQELAIQGKSKELFCAAVGNPVPKIKWLRLNNDQTESKEIENGKGGFLLKDNGVILRIEPVSKTQHEDGYYQCVASNGVGKDDKTKPTKLQVVVPPLWTTEPPSEYSIPIESDDSLLCEALGSPPPSYKWYYNGTAFKSDDELGPNIIVDNKFLRFKNMKQHNQGVFQCAVENDYGMLVSSTWVKVKANKPDILKFGPFYLFKGTNATLKCESNAAPRADHTWYHNGKKLEIKGRYSLDKQGSLIIRNVVDSDGGKYKCAAKNSIGNDEATESSTVYERTVIIRKSPANVIITLDKPLDLQCEARADPRLKAFLKYKWLKDNAPLKYDSRVIWMGSMNILRIKKAIVTDGAMYKCVAYTDTKQYSEDTFTTIADVEGVPSPPFDLSITDCSNASTTISWKKGKDNDSPTTKFIVEQESTYAPEEWIVIANISQPNARKYTLPLTLWADLTFRMRAVNKIGPSRASLPTGKKQCITKQGLPTEFPKNLRGIPGKANELDIAWTAMTKLQANAPGLRYILFYETAEDYEKNNKQFIKKVTITDHTTERFKVPNAGYYIKWKFQIVARNNIGPGPVSNIQESYSGQNAPTGQPKDVQIGKIFARKIELSWNRVDIEGRGSIDGYKIYYWGQSKSDSTNIRSRREIPPGASVFIAEHTTKDRQKVTVTGLTPYSSYTLAIKAFNSGGEGPSSDELSFDTKEDVPGEVSTFKAYAFSSYIFASWGEPLEKNGILLGYSIAAVKYKDNQKIKVPPESAFVNVETNKFEHLFDNMEANSRYVVYLRARTKIGAGPDQRADLKTISPAKPSRPRAPKVNAKTTTSVNVTFLFGESPGGYPLEFKVLYRETASNASFKETGWFNHLEKRWALVGDLAVDRLHDFKTVGRNKQGTSVDSPITKARPLPAVGYEKGPQPYYLSTWFLVLMGLLALLLILLLILCLCRKSGKMYPVRKREEERGINFPVEEDEPIDLGRLDENAPLHPTRQDSTEPSESSKVEDDDRESLDDDDEEGAGFGENGSFTEEYGDDKKILYDDKRKSDIV